MHTTSLVDKPGGRAVCGICGGACNGVGHVSVHGGVRFHPKEVPQVTQSTYYGKYIVDRRVFENGFLTYTPGDEVDRPTAIRIGLIQPDPAPQATPAAPAEPAAPATPEPAPEESAVPAIDGPDDQTLSVGVEDRRETTPRRSAARNARDEPEAETR